MSLSHNLLTILSSRPRGCRLPQVGIRNYARPGKSKKKILNVSNASRETIQVTLYRLKKRGLVESNAGIWKLTQLGKESLSRLTARVLPRHSEKVFAKKTKDMIISFDVPEKYKTKRDWLRAELICLGFSMLQKSVWFGPAPLPKNFIDSLRLMNLLPYIKFFEAKEADII
jgi:DNA-binding transcriptional regulator PaaX